MAKRKFELPSADINVIPLMDILTTMLFFLILMASFTNYSSLDALSELLSGASSKENKQKFDLVVAVKNDQYSEVHLGPINEIEKVMFKDELEKYLLKNQFTGSLSKGFKKIYEDKTLVAISPRIQKDLVEIKKSFPHEMKLTLTLQDQVNFQSVISFMSLLTSLASEHEAFALKNLLGMVEQTRILFPEIALQEWGGGEL